MPTTNHALEVLKYSSSIHYTGDQGIVRDNMSAYDRVASAADYLELYFSMKEKLALEAHSQYDWNTADLAEFLRLQYSTPAMFEFVHRPFTREFVELAGDQSEEVGRVIARIARKYRIK